MKKHFKLGCALLMTLVILPFTIRAEEISTNISLSCDKTDLNFGESTNCYIELESNTNLSAWKGEITVGDGLKIDSATSMNNKYSVVKNSNNIVVSITDENAAIETISKQKLIQIKVSAIENAKVSNANISIQTLSNCNDTLIGDINQDGKVSNDDALLALQIATSRVNATDYHVRVGDFNGNGSIDAEEVLYISKMATKDINPSTSTILGDADNDGDIDEDDANYVLQVATKKIVLTDEEMDELLKIADFDQNQSIDTSDVLIIENVASGKIDLGNMVIGQKYLCANANKELSTNNSSISFKIGSSVNVPATASTLSIALIIIGICLVAIGTVIIIKTEKRKKQQ